jgi:hypothetical protein
MVRNKARLKPFQQGLAVCCSYQSTEDLHDKDEEHRQEGVALTKLAGMTYPLAWLPIQKYLSTGAGEKSGYPIPPSTWETHMHKNFHQKRPCDRIKGLCHVNLEQQTCHLSRMEQTSRPADEPEVVLYAAALYECTLRVVHQLVQLWS